MRKAIFAEGEYYHIYNRGVEKRNLFSDRHDFDRFILSIKLFNNVKTIGSIQDLSYKQRLSSLATGSELVGFVCYCINPNHYHFLLDQKVPGGITKFMHRLGSGYTRYFNDRHKRSGALFQGTFKAIHVETNEYLLHLSAYINLNSQIHKLSGLATEWKKSSWREYLGQGKILGICNKSIVLDQFKSKDDYKKFAISSLNEIRKRKDELKEVEFGEI